MGQSRGQLGLKSTNQSGSWACDVILPIGIEQNGLINWTQHMG